MRYHFGPFRAVERHPGFWSWMPPEGSFGGLDCRPLAYRMVRAGSRAAQGYGMFITPDDVTLDSSYDLIGQGDIRELRATPVMRSLIAARMGVPSVSGDTAIQCIFDARQQGDPEAQQSCPCLLPRRDRTIGISLPEHGRVLSVAFDANAPQFSPQLGRMRLQYRRLREQSKDGLRGGRVPDAEFHRRWLDGQARKLRVNNIEDLLIDADLPKEGRLPVGTQYTESFTGDGDAIGADRSWTEVAGDWDRVSGEARPQTVGGSVWLQARLDDDMGAADFWSQIDHETTDAAFDDGLSFYVLALGRFASAASTFYGARLRSNTSGPGAFERALEETIANGNAVLATGTGVSTGVGAARITLDSDDLTASFAGGADVTTTDGSIDGIIVGGLRGGIGAYQVGSAPIVMDNYVIDDGITGGGGPSIRRFTGAQFNAGASFHGTGGSNIGL